MLAITRRSAIILLTALSIIAVAQNLWYWIKLPPRIATHFGLTGQPNAWMSKTNGTLLAIGFQLGMPWFLVGIGLWIKYLPSSLINIPNRQYWLGPGRREPTLAYLLHFMSSVAIAMPLLAMALNHLTFVANARGQALNLQAFVLVLALFLLIIAVLILAMWRRLRFH